MNIYGLAIFVEFLINQEDDCLSDTKGKKLIMIDLYDLRRGVFT